MHVFTDIFHQKSPAEKFITINKQVIELHRKEQKIYKETLKFEKRHQIISSFDYLFYDFQIYCEFIENNKKNFNLKYDWEFYDLLDNFSLVMRFLKIWYYETCGIYIRKTFEEWVKLISWEEWNKNFKKGLEKIINLRISEIWPMIFDLEEVYKLYKYLSEKYTHHHWNVENIEFNASNYLEIEWLSIMIIITICNITVQLADFDEVEKHWKDKIEQPVEEYTEYRSYIWPLVSSAFISWCHTWFMQGMDYTNINDFDFWKSWKWLNLYKWIYNYRDIDTSNIKLPEN